MLNLITGLFCRNTGGRMKFHTDSPSYGSYCLSTEMFYVEIVVSDGNRAVDAKVHHIDGSQTSQSGQPSVQVTMCFCET